MRLPVRMTAAEFYDEYTIGDVCEILQAGDPVRVRVKGAYLLAGRVIIGDSHGRSFRLDFTDAVTLIAR
jgi:hypothetical protein